MHRRKKNYLSCFLWIATLLCVGSLIGWLSKPEVDGWYATLHRSALTPPDHVFPIAWTILYTLIALSGWHIWRSPPFPKLRKIKRLYLLQLLLNWSWMPLFFGFHWIEASLLCLLLMDAAVVMIVYCSLRRLPIVSLLMAPYLCWILFATYLNFYLFP
jgi:benzodiazapine receptor